MGRDQGNASVLVHTLESLFIFLNWCRSSFSSGGGKPIASATPAGDFGIGPEQLVLMSKDHNIASLQQYGGVSSLVSLLSFLCLFYFLGLH